MNVRNFHTDPNPGLADKLKQATWGQHKQAENTGVIASILKQTVEITSYTHYLRNLHHIYQGFEQLPENSIASDPIYPFLDSKLHRSQAIAHDLQQLIGDDWANLTLLETAKAYRNRLDKISNSEIDNKHAPITLLGHIYVRYLGDLNGGQVLQRQLSKQFDIAESALSFYTFTDIKDLSKYRKNYRNRLNQLHVEDSDREGIISEAIASFHFNIELSREINTHVAKPQPPCDS